MVPNMTQMSKMITLFVSTKKKTQTKKIHENHSLKTSSMFRLIHLCWIEIQLCTLEENGEDVDVSAPYSHAKPSFQVKHFEHKTKNATPQFAYFEIPSCF